MDYLWISLLLIGGFCVWLTNFVTLPGNWGVLLAAALDAAFVPDDVRFRVSWWAVALLFALALLGEGLEFVAGLMGAAKQGGSRRAMALSLVGAVIGSLIGVVVGVPVPIVGSFVGSFVGALLGAGGGAFAGAYIGEATLGRTHAESYAVGEQAFVGRLLGTGAKITCGAVMLVALAVDTLLL